MGLLAADVCGSFSYLIGHKYNTSSSCIEGALKVSAKEAFHVFNISACGLICSLFHPISFFDRQTQISIFPTTLSGFLLILLTSFCLASSLIFCIFHEFSLYFCPCSLYVMSSYRRKERNANFITTATSHRRGRKK